MRGRWLLAKWGFVLGSGTVLAQPPSLPQPPPSTIPGPIAPSFPQTRPQPPGPLPPLRPTGPAMPVAPNGFPGVNAPGSPPLPTPGAYAPGSPNSVAKPFEAPFPQPENKFTLNAADVTVKRLAGSWQLWAGQKMLRDFG